MRYKKKLSAYLKAVKKYSEQDDAFAADIYPTVYRECAELRAGIPTFARFYKTQAFSELCARLLETIRSGQLPDTEDLIRRFPGFLSVGENENLRNTIRFLLTQIAAAACSAKDDTTIRNATLSFFKLKDLNFAQITSCLCKADCIFSSEKADIYAHMHPATKEKYLHLAEIQAKKEKISTEIFAEKIVREADEKGIHVGFLLPLQKKNAKEGKSLILSAYLLSAFTCIAVGILIKSIAVGVLTFLPVTDLYLHLMRMTAAIRKKPTVICRMDRQTTQQHMNTVITVSAVLPKAQELQAIQTHLQKLYLANRQTASGVCLLADLPVADTAVLPEDKTNTAAVIRMIDRLNTQFGDRFVLALRERSFSKTERAYIGKERKRGAVLALANYIHTGENDFKILHGNREMLRSCAYMMLLDADTTIPFDGLRHLVSAAIHPLNMPVIDEKMRTVSRGYGILSPNAAPSVKSFSSCRFSRDMCKAGGISAYDRAANDFYGDFFANGIFCGKGLVHIKTFCQTMNGRFREETMLSHDIAEGLIMRVLPVTDLTLTDDFPKTENAYFKRANRWIRGDIQNLPLLSRNIFAFGERVKSPFGFEEKYKLFDNLRRALTPIASFVGILCSVFLPPLPCCVTLSACVLLRGAADFLHGISSLLQGGVRALSGKYKEDALPDALSAFIRGALLMTQTVTEGTNALDAVLRSLWRMVVSGKHLLSWTTAAAADHATGFAAVCIPRIPLLLTAGLLFLTARPCAILYGLVFLFDLFYAYISQKEIRKKTSGLSQSGKIYIQSECAAMWQYFADHFREEYHYLPPDNISVSPLPDTALRTSPTNIGLALCVYLAARDLGFIDSSSLYDTLNRTLSSVEKLERWEGNLLNWYDIKTMQPLSPRTASFVDSGNLICCITALKEGLYEYISEEPRLSDLVVRLSALRDNCKLSAFYNENRRLFSISYDTEQHAFSDSYYDLLMSEARMASFIAVANGQVPSEHWAALARTSAKCGRFTGALSWSGTMFEYFMPYIFLPSDKNTLTDESLWFCVKSQMQYARQNKIPWGISESCFYAFHRDLSYRYKANGVPNAALQRISKKERIVSPYASFLTLPFIPSDSYRNLRRLEKYPAKGIYGFYEALDFTPGRANGKEPAPVRCFMVHHLGMSLLSAENALFDCIWQKRLMRDICADAAEGLLQERIPTAISYYKAEKEAGTTEKEKRNDKKETELSAALYEGVGISAALHENGCMYLSSRGISLLRQSNGILSEPCGIFAAIRTRNGIVPFTKEPGKNDNVKYRHTFEKDGAEYTSKTDEFKLSQQIAFDREQSCMRIRYRIKNLTGKPSDAALLLYFEPSLAGGREENAHRTYSKLFIQSKRSEKNNCVLFTRTKASRSFSLAVGFLDAEFSVTTDKDPILPLDGGVRGIFSKYAEPNGRTGSTDCCFFAETDFRIGAKKELTFTLCLTAAQTAEEAENAFMTVKNRPFLQKYACKQFTDDLQKEALCTSALNDTVFPDRKYALREDYAQKNCGGIEQLWAHGISGDDPIIVFDATGADSTAIRNFTDVSAKLHANGIKNDLVLLYDPREQSAETLRKSADADHAVFFCRQDASDSAQNLLCAVSAGLYPEDRAKQTQPITELYSASAYNPTDAKNGVTPDGFRITTHPPVPWSQTLCNRSFGCLVTDRNLGFTWSLNSAENKLTPWINDPHADTAGEILSVCRQDRHFDLIAGAAAEFLENCARWQSHAQGCIFTTEVCVPAKGMRKDIRITIRNTAQIPFQGSLCYTVNPVMGRDLSYSRTILRKPTANGVLLRNPYNRDFDGCLLLTGDRAVYRPGLRFYKNASLSDGITLQTPLDIDPGGELTVCYTVSYGMCEHAAVRMQALTLPQLLPQKPLIRSGDRDIDTLVNQFLPHQARNTRLFARCAFYQCGGAYGFRDQLQDSLNLLRPDPDLLRIQLFRSAASQFPEGDVLHWWHVTLPDGHLEKRGVRTRCSDDLVWLPYAAAAYVAATKDNGILSVQIPFCCGEKLKENERDRYFTPKQSEEKVSLYEHCTRALDRAIVCGKHGLILIGSGDWNDSFDRVGIKGAGESVWLTMFCILTLKKFLPLCQYTGDDAHYERYRQLISTLTDHVEQHAWDTDRYIRAFYDDASPMGAKNAASCRIDLLPQSFASLAGLPNQKRIETALKTAYDLLYDRKNALVKLFTPPFYTESKETGYVNDYPPGVRENGGQYTHAVIWFIKALAQSGFKKEAEEILKSINPLSKLGSDGLTGIYRNEPYALSGDVYSLKHYEGRGGWSHYTGAAGWLLSTALELYPPADDVDRQQA